MRVRVTRVNIPDFSTIGVGYGTDQDGNEVRFGDDHRPMRDLGYKILAAGQTGEDPPEVEIERRVPVRELHRRTGVRRSLRGFDRRRDFAIR